jgi:hypothetical protein
LRRKRATAKSAPQFSMAATVAGGICKIARAVLGMKFKQHEKYYFVNIYVHI